MSSLKSLVAVLRDGPLLRDATASGNLRVLASFLGPAWRGFVRHLGRDLPETSLRARGDVTFEWRYQDAFPELDRLYQAAKNAQWNAAAALDWSVAVDPRHPERPLLPEEFLPFSELAAYRKASPEQRREQVHSLLAWMLSQFLHGEQGALFAAAQVAEAVPWLEGKL